MSYRRTLVFLIIFAVLAAFYYFYEIKGGETRRLDEEHEKLLFSFGKDEATRLTLEKGEDAIVLEKRGDEWEISAPVSAPADDAAVEGMLDLQRRLHPQRDPRLYVRDAIRRQAEDSHLANIHMLERVVRRGE